MEVKIIYNGPVVEIDRMGMEIARYFSPDNSYVDSPVYMQGYPIDAEEADAMISDTLAMKTANYESGAGHGQHGIINIGVLNQNFEANDVITLAALKEKGLVPKKVGRMKVLADGILTKPLTIKSESYSIQAIKMIELTGGTVIILKD